MSYFSDHSALIKSATYLSMLTAVIIITAKIIGWWTTNSIAMLASLIDSMLDIIASSINVIAIRVALLPPDNKHRFGHDKVQDLAVFTQSIFFFLSGGFIIISSVQRLLYHSYDSTDEIINNSVGFKVMIFSIACTLLLLLYQSYVLKITRSHLIAADRIHYFTDLLTNLAVVVSIGLTHEYWFVDPIIGIAIALYLWIASYRIFRSVLANLSDQEFNHQQKETLRQILKYHKAKGAIIDVHELKTRTAGNKHFIQFHLELDGNITLYKAHELSEQVMHDIYKAFPGSEVIIHQDPAGIEEQEGYREHLTSL